MKLTNFYTEVVVDASPKKCWEALKNYGDVAQTHASLESSSAINDSPNQACLGADRICVIPDFGMKITIKEKIIDFKEGEYYTYDVYEWKNFPLRKMVNTFGTKKNAKGQTVMYIDQNVRLKPGFLLWFMKWKLKAGNRSVLLTYKHLVETGEKRPDTKMLEEKYKTF